MVSDPRIQRLRDLLAARSAIRFERRSGQHEAAVALLIRPGEHLDILLIKRAERAADPWSGHMALPGGRRTPEDADLIATALRETEEETAVPLRAVGDVLGSLDEVAPSSPRLPPILIAPVVVAVPPDTTACPDGHEVDATLCVPLAELRSPAAASEILVELSEGQRTFPSLRYGEHIIWGLTLRILLQFMEVADVAGV